MRNSSGRFINGHTVTNEMRLKMSHAATGQKRHTQKHSEETKRRISEAKKGKKPWNYIEDRTKLSTDNRHCYCQRYREWMFAVKNRDGWKCKINDKNCHGKIEAHHILSWVEFPELRYDVNNGVSLCHHHHPRERVEEKRLSSYLASLIK